MTKNEIRNWETREIYNDLFFSLQIFAKPFMSQETIPLQTLKEDYTYALTKELQMHQTILFGKIQQETDSSSILDPVVDGESAQNHFCLMVIIIVKVSIS